jgi:hypothetical protein
MAIFNVRMALVSGSVESILVKAATAQDAAKEVETGLTEDGVQVKGVVSNIRMTKAQASRVLASGDIRNWTDL